MKGYRLLIPVFNILSQNFQSQKPTGRVQRQSVCARTERSQLLRLLKSCRSEKQTSLEEENKLLFQRADSFTTSFAARIRSSAGINSKALLKRVELCQVTPACNQALGLVVRMPSCCQTLEQLLTDSRSVAIARRVTKHPPSLLLQVALLKHLLLQTNYEQAIHLLSFLSLLPSLCVFSLKLNHINCEL